MDKMRKGIMIGLAFVLFFGMSVAYGDVLLYRFLNYNETTDTTTVNQNLDVVDNVTASYYFGDASLLSNLPSGTSFWNRTGTTLEPATTGDEVNLTGKLYLEGNARVIKIAKQVYPYNFGAIAGTYNGVVCATTGGLGTLNNMYFRTFDDGQGAGNPEVVNFNAYLPEDYVDGTDITIKISSTVGGTSTNNVRIQAGLTAISDGDTFSPNTWVWATPQNVAGTGTAWENQQLSFTISGTGIVKGDDLGVAVFRDADNGADNYSGDSYIESITVEYLSDRLGG